MNRLENVSRFPKTKKFAARSTAVLGVGLALIGCSKSVDGSTPATTQSPTRTEAPRTPEPTTSPDREILPPVYDPLLEDPSLCVGTSESTTIVAPDQFTVTQKGHDEVIVCDLSGVGLVNQQQNVDSVIINADCVLDEERPVRYFKYPSETAINTIVFPVVDSNCINTLTPASQTQPTI